MYYTIIFYVLIAFFAFGIRNREQSLKAIFILAALYMSLRYNYPSDYPAYQAVFESYSNPAYVYSSDYDHMEYGWYLINRLFAPLGYPAFVAFCSCVFALGLYGITKMYVPKEYIPLVALGLFSVGSFTTLLSAQRQLLVTGIFLISYRYLLSNRINTVKDLLSWRVILYFLVIFLCQYFHRSAIFLMVVPFFHLLPSKSLFVLLGILVSALFILFFGDRFLSPFFYSLQEQYEQYDYLVFSGEWSGSITVLQSLMWIFQFVNVVIIYLNYQYTNEVKAVLLLSMFSILITLSGYSLGQTARLAYYIYAFSFMAIAIIASKLRDNSYRNIYLLINWVWVIWNLFKVFRVPRGTLFEYKLLLLNL